MRDLKREGDQLSTQLQNNQNWIQVGPTFNLNLPIIVVTGFEEGESVLRFVYEISTSAKFPDSPQVEIWLREIEDFAITLVKESSSFKNYLGEKAIIGDIMASSANFDVMLGSIKKGRIYNVKP